MYRMMIMPAGGNAPGKWQVASPAMSLLDAIHIAQTHRRCLSRCSYAVARYWGNAKGDQRFVYRLYAEHTQKGKIMQTGDLDWLRKSVEKHGLELTRNRPGDGATRYFITDANGYYIVTALGWKEVEGKWRAFLAGVEYGKA